MKKSILELLAQNPSILTNSDKKAIKGGTDGSGSGDGNGEGENGIILDDTDSI